MGHLAHLLLFNKIFLILLVLRSKNVPESLFVFILFAALLVVVANYVGIDEKERVKIKNSKP